MHFSPEEILCPFIESVAMRNHFISSLGTHSILPKAIPKFDLESKGRTSLTGTR